MMMKGLLRHQFPVIALGMSLVSLLFLSTLLPTSRDPTEAELEVIVEGKQVLEVASSPSSGPSADSAAAAAADGEEVELADDRESIESVETVAPEPVHPLTNILSVLAVGEPVSSISTGSTNSAENQLPLPSYIDALAEIMQKDLSERNIQVDVLTEMQVCELQNGFAKDLERSGIYSYDVVLLQVVPHGPVQKQFQCILNLLHRAWERTDGTKVVVVAPPPIQWDTVKEEEDLLELLRRQAGARGDRMMLVQLPTRTPTPSQSQQKSMEASAWTAEWIWRCMKEFVARTAPE